MRCASTMLFAICLFIGALSGARVEAQSTMILVGAASRSVTPAASVWIAGDAPGRRSTGVHDDLFVKAVLFDDGKTPVAVLTVDCIGLHYPDVQRIRAAVAKAAVGVSLTPERVIVCSTHCHSGPDVIGIWGQDRMHSGYESAFVDSVIAKAAEAGAEAAARRVAARIVHAETSCSEWVVNECEPGDLDSSVTILQCLDATSGASIATLTNFACHPTIMDAATSLLSADYIGPFYAHMSKSIPGEHLFLQGAIGGWVQPDKGNQTFEVAELRGNDLATKSLAALRSAVPLPGTSIRFANRVISIPAENEGFRQLSAAGIVKRDISEHIETEVAWFSIGEAQFATHPGETAPAHGRATKEMMRSGPKFVIGLGLDELGYILKPEYFEAGRFPHAEYLTSMSPGPKAAPIMLEALREIIP